MGGSKYSFSKWFLYCSFLCAAMLFICGPAIGQEEKKPAEAQATAEQADDEFNLEEIVVTGSRIVRRDNESNSPIVTIDAIQFEQRAGLNIESYMNQLPEYNPAQSPVTTQQDVQISPINSVGVATISLRGFGPNRNLALVDGKRSVPTNALMWTDINGIPSALIERVETISGGASAVYGADAVGGVTNFILKKNYEGLQVDAQYGINEVGDGDESRVSMLWGANLADDKGNVTFGAERYKREIAYAKERDWYTDRMKDPTAAGYFMFYMGQNAYNCSTNCPTNGALNALFGGQAPGAYYYYFGPGGASTAPMNSGIGMNFNPDGTIWVAGNPIGESRFDRTQINDSLVYGDVYALSNKDSATNTTYTGIKWNHPDQWVSAPQDRYSLFSNAHYNINDKISVFGGARFAQSVTKTMLMGNNATSGWEASVPYNPTTDSPINPAIAYSAENLAAVAANPAAFFAANPNPNYRAPNTTGAGHPVPAELAWLLNSRTTPDARWIPHWNTQTSVPFRQTTNTIQTWQLEGGVDFDLPFRDWTGQVYMTHGESATYNVAGGSLSLARYRALVNYPNWGAGASGTGNQFYSVNSEAGVATVNTDRPKFGSGDFTCTSGFYNVFFGGDQPLSEDCLNAVSANLQTRTEMSQDIYELNLQGGLFNLPAGEVRSAAGYQYRKVKGVFNPDVLQSQDSFMDEVIGVYPTGYLDAKTEVKDMYVEALVPVLADLPLIEKFELELGARYSDYKETGDTEYTYKMLGTWTPKKWLRFRGGYNRAIRAPNLGELFLNQQEVFTMGTVKFGDPCNIRSNAPWGAGGTTLADDENITAAEIAADPTHNGLPQVVSGQTQAGADMVKQLCDIMMGPVASANYYDGIVGAADNTKDFVYAGSAFQFNWLLQKGNPNLKPETADTWTAGLVMNSPFEKVLFSDITLAFDWYKIKITDAIMLNSIDYSNYACFSQTGLSVADQAASFACQNVARDTMNGVALSTMLTYTNQALIDTNGFDIMLNWRADLAAMGLNSVPGSLNLNVKATVLDSYKTRVSPAFYDIPVEFKGSLGPNLSGTQGGAYDYRLNTTLTYSNVRYPWNVSLLWRHLPGVWSANKAVEDATIANNKRYLKDPTSGLFITYTPTTEIETDSYDIFDLNGSWDINETWSLRLGVNNLFQKDPISSGSSAGYAPGTDLTTVCSAEAKTLGCTNPTSHSLYSNGGFNASYYDTVGRRYFIGIKAKF